MAFVFLLLTSRVYTVLCARYVQTVIALLQAGFYRRFVEGFSRIAQPLTDLTQIADGKGFSWGDREQSAFDELKRALTSAPVLAHPDPQRQWTVQTDASGYAIGAVLSQVQEDGTTRPVAFWSQKLNSADAHSVLPCAQVVRDTSRTTRHSVVLRSAITDGVCAEWFTNVSTSMTSMRMTAATSKAQLAGKRKRAVV